MENTIIGIARLGNTNLCLVVLLFLFHLGSCGCKKQRLTYTHSCGSIL